MTLPNYGHDTAKLAGVRFVSGTFLADFSNRASTKLVRKVKLLTLLFYWRSVFFDGKPVSPRRPSVRHLFFGSAQENASEGPNDPLRPWQSRANSSCVWNTSGTKVSRTAPSILAIFQSEAGFCRRCRTRSMSCLSRRCRSQSWTRCRCLRRTASHLSGAGSGWFSTRSVSRLRDPSAYFSSSAIMVAPMLQGVRGRQAGQSVSYSNDTGRGCLPAQAPLRWLAMCIAAWNLRVRYAAKMLSCSARRRSNLSLAR